MAEEVKEDVHYYSIPEFNVCFKKTVVLDSLEPIGNSSDISLASFSVQSEIADCSTIVEQTLIISKINNPEPILINGSGKIVEYISSIDEKIIKIGEQKVTLQKSDFFAGKGTMFYSLTNECLDLEIELTQLKRRSFGDDFIQAPELRITAKNINCTKVI